MRNTAILKWIEKGDQNVVHKEDARSNFRCLFQTSHILNRKPIALPVEHIVFLIDCIVAISEVNSGLFIKLVVTKACPVQQHKHKPS